MSQEASWIKILDDDQVMDHREMTENTGEDEPSQIWDVDWVKEIWHCKIRRKMKTTVPKRGVEKVYVGDAGRVARWLAGCITGVGVLQLLLPTTGSVVGGKCSENVCL